MRRPRATAARRGPAPARAGERARPRRRVSGFTLVEVMTVVAIVGLLVSLLIFGLNQYRKSSYQKGTQGILGSVRAALDAYHGQYRLYPPDGFDEPTFREVRGGGKQQIRGTACLIYYLGFPTVEETEYGSEKRYAEKDPFLQLTADMLSGDGTLEEKLADPSTEIIDRWGNPIHYDNVEKGKDGKTPRLSPQDSASVHTMKGLDPGSQHGPDPRLRSATGGPTGGLAAQNPGSYDLWSHGA